MTADNAPHMIYQNPLNTRYASQEMSHIWSAQTKHSLWRELWVALAECEQELGLPIETSQIEQLKANIQNIDFENAARHEKSLRHDVMAHVHAYGDVCPDAKAIIHLGATSCFVTDNSELIQIRRALELTRKRLVNTIDQLAQFAELQKNQPCLGFTHLQPAQPLTIGKRATLWCYELVMDLEEIEHRLATLKFRGVKGTTGTQASFLQLFEGDHEKVRQLDRMLCEKMGFESSYQVTGQTYTRKVDAFILQSLSGIAQSLHKTATDVRILQHRKEVEEPFEKNQIGSSAMAYKRNPMRSERICALARFAMSLTSNGEQTAATQWMERTLDDSANRRLSLPQSFLSVDASLILMRNVVDGMVVYPKVIEKNLAAELPFMATEEILMQAVKQGGDRQELHERIRVHSIEAGKVVKQEGGSNDMMDRLAVDEAFQGIDLSSALDPMRYVGRSPEQVEEFISALIQPIREKYASDLTEETEELKV